MQMHNGTRTGEGSFNVALKELFYKAAIDNQHKLVAAFPEFFGEEVPEFGIYKQQPPAAVVRLKELALEIKTRDADAAVVVAARTSDGVLELAYGKTLDVAAVLAMFMHHDRGFASAFSKAWDVYRFGAQPKSQQ